MSFSMIRLIFDHKRIFRANILNFIQGNVMIEKAGTILQVDSRYALVQLTNQTRNNFFAKLRTMISPNGSSNITTTIRARNSIYAQPNDTVVIGLPSQPFFGAFIKQTGNGISNPAIILRCTTPAAVSY